MLAPLTRAGNLPFRRLCVEQGAAVTCSEMVLARNLLRRPKQEGALLRRHPTERCFGVQLAGRIPQEAAEAARMAVDAGADYIDINFGCPIDGAVRRGYGAAMLENPRRIERLLTAVRAAIDVPLGMKIRLGYREGKENHQQVARIGEALGVDFITVHGRTREQRYRRAADWERIGEVVEAVGVPVIGNGDILHASDATERLRNTGCVAVMAARGALIQPWLWSDLATGDRPRSGQERLELARRWVGFAIEHWGDDEHGFVRIREFLELHVDFWRRYVPPDRSDEPVTLQGRGSFEPCDEIEATLAARGDDGLAAACALILEPFAPPAGALRSGRRRDASGGWG